MKNFTKGSNLVYILLAVAIIGVITVISISGIGKRIPGKSQGASVASADLLTSTNFAILAGSAIVDSNISVISGDIGLAPASGSFIGVPCAEMLSGTIYATDAAAAALCAVSNSGLVDQAKLDLTTAYNFTANETPAVTLAGADNQLGGKTLTPGIYTFSAASNANLIGTVTLDGGGNPNAVFVFQTASTLKTDSAGAVVQLTNGTQACNVFWQVGTSATLGTGTQFVGTIMADQSITDSGGSTIIGRLLARIAAVTINNTHITVPICDTPTTETITVIKNVVGGPKVVADFPLQINGAPFSSGNTDNFSAPATYTVTEPSNVDYTATYSGDCPGGVISLTLGTPKICTITNTYTAPTAGSGGGSSGGSTPHSLVPPLIEVVKVPSPLALPNGPGPVTYTYTLNNIGTIPVHNLKLVGDTCSPIILSSGDTNSDNILDLTEHWVYKCSTTLSKTHTNTVVATGDANGITATDVASATVIVGVPIVPPLIHVTKIPSPLALSAGGGSVTYTNKVTNPGTVALSDVILKDDKCNPVNYISGDTNNNAKLDVNETWTYTCKTNITQTTTNTIVATGYANGLTARDFAIATVVVGVPGLPKTGFPPREFSK